MKRLILLAALVAALVTAALAGNIISAPPALAASGGQVVHPMSPPCCDGGGSAVCTTPNRGWNKTWAIGQTYWDSAPYSYPGSPWVYNGGLDIFYDPNVYAYSFTYYPNAPVCRVLYAVNPPRAAWFVS